MAVTIQMTMTGLDQVRRTLFQLVSAQSRRGLMKVLAEEARDQVAEEFAEARDPYGRPWVRSHRARLEGGKTLTDTAILRRSITTNPDLLQISPAGFTLGTNVPYAAVHQFGRTIRPKKGKYLTFRGPGAPAGKGKRAGRGGFARVTQVRIPRRPILPDTGLPQQWARAFESTALAYLESQLR
jgi:phage gpG-like protein